MHVYSHCGILKPVTTVRVFVYIFELESQCTLLIENTQVEIRNVFYTTIVRYNN
jgi:hypothetical protein